MLRLLRRILTYHYQHALFTRTHGAFCRHDQFKIRGRETCVPFLDFQRLTCLFSAVGRDLEFIFDAHFGDSDVDLINRIRDRLEEMVMHKLFSQEGMMAQSLELKRWYAS